MLQIRVAGVNFWPNVRSFPAVNPHWEIISWESAALRLCALAIYCNIIAAISYFHLTRKAISAAGGAGVGYYEGGGNWKPYLLRDGRGEGGQNEDRSRM